MIVPEQLVVLVRALVYAGAIAVAGGVLFRLSFPQAAQSIKPVLQRQIAIGFCLLLVVEPLRYSAFQLAIAGGDWSLAFGPDLRWMGMQTPIGQAAAVRLIAAAAIVAVGLRWPPVGATAAFVLIGSFLLEGHTAASEGRLLVAPLLLVHLAAVSWWLGALFPLIAVTRRADPAVAVATIELFGSRAVLVVGALLTAGALQVVMLTGGEVRLDIAWQQRLLIKLGLVAALLSVAAVNKLRFTPLLTRDYALGAARLRTSIRVEIAVAFTILASTAWLIGTAPDA
jgi:putative copper resistance protein D